MERGKPEVLSPPLISVWMSLSVFANLKRVSVAIEEFPAILCIGFGEVATPYRAMTCDSINVIQMLIS